MPNPNYDELLSAAVQLDALRYRTLMRLIGGIPEDLAAPLPTGIVVRVLLYDWLLGLNLWTPERLIELLTVLGPELDSFSLTFDASPGTRRLPFMLLIDDFQYVALLRTSVSGLPDRGFYDMRRGEWLAQLPCQAVTMFLCDVNVLMFRLAGKIERARQEKAHGQPSAIEPAGPQPPAAPAGDPAQP